MTQVEEGAYRLAEDGTCPRRQPLPFLNPDSEGSRDSLLLAEVRVPESHQGLEQSITFGGFVFSEENQAKVPEALYNRKGAVYSGWWCCGHFTSYCQLLNTFPPLTSA